MLIKTNIWLKELQLNLSVFDFDLRLKPDDPGEFIVKVLSSQKPQERLFT